MVRWEKEIVPTLEEREAAALRREGEQYAAAGMLDRARLVNEQLEARGLAPVDCGDEPRRQTRTSTQAATRKRAAKPKASS